MNSTTKLIVGTIIAIVVIWAGYSLFKGGVLAPTGPIEIGVTAPLTGEAASLGEGFAAGAQLAAKEINDSGGINGRKIELVMEDDQCSAKGVNTITKLVEIDKVVAIVGPLCSAAGGPGLPVAQKAGVPVLITASAPHLTKIGDYIFRNYPSDAFQGKFAAGYIFNTLGKRRAAVIYVKNDWGQGIHDVFIARFQELGGTIVYDDGIPQDSKDLRTFIAKAKAANPDVIYFPVYPANGIAGFKQMKEAGIRVPIIGGDAFAGEDVWRAPEATGVLYTIAKTGNPEEFKNRVKAATGKETGAYGSFSYDATKIFAKVMAKVGTDSKAIRDELARTVYSEAIAVPVVEFDANGDLKAAEFEVMIIRNGKAEPYQP